MRSILVGDLEELPLALKVGHLAEFGHQVVAARDADVLRDRLHGAERPFDLVVMESIFLRRLPGVRIEDCVARLRPCPRLIITADFAPASQLLDTPFLVPLCDDYLVRPFSLEAFGESVQRVLARGPRDGGPPGSPRLRGPGGAAYL